MNQIETAHEFIHNLFLIKKALQQKHLEGFVRGEKFALQYIHRNNGEVQPGDISSAMENSSAQIAVILNNLEKKELITRRIDKEDRRKILVGITESGKEIAEKQAGEVVDCIIKFMDDLGENDTKEFFRIINNITIMLQSDKQ